MILYMYIVHCTMYLYCLASEVLKDQIDQLNFSYMMVGWVFEYLTDNKFPSFQRDPEHTTSLVYNNIVFLKMFKIGTCFIYFILKVKRNI